MQESEVYIDSHELVYTRTHVAFFTSLFVYFEFVNVYVYVVIN